MKNDKAPSSKVSRNLKYVHVLMIWDELSEIVGGDKHIGAVLTAAYFCSQMAGSPSKPTTTQAHKFRAARSASKVGRRGNPRNRSKPNRRTKRKR